ncbi:glycosyltransferase [Paenibacillus polymyxa]|uniref:glycosyltransferase family 2 protein n=1 Tax=Paenibacillus polymyxa TaxID=1406 RepID=UPI002AB42813|nr:glycosyltransferase [Paenibacillus polymyxa]MDY7991478.1 glycosyltransferase [Paenibacillus polymyxa]MDY8117919.1 glycosyltransferase [Paenibacillus polymyxa]
MFVIFIIQNIVKFLKTIFFRFCNIHYVTYTLFVRAKIKYNPLQLLTNNSWYNNWIDTHETYIREDVIEECNSFKYRPLISILLPVFNVDEKYLRECIESVIDQYYGQWELCIADDCSTYPHVHKILEEYQLKDNRIHVVYRSKNGHISACSNTALNMAHGDFIALLDNDDILPPHALFEVVKRINEYPDVEILYSNEDKLKNGERVQPFFKKKWSFPLLLHINYICHLAVYKTSLIKNIGGFRKGYEGAQDWDLAIRALGRTNKVQHIAKMLYHWRISPTSTAGGENIKPYVKQKHKRIKSEFLKKQKLRRG